MQEKLHGGNIALLYLIFRDHISALPVKGVTEPELPELLMYLFFKPLSRKKYDAPVAKLQFRLYIIGYCFSQETQG